MEVATRMAAPGPQAAPNPIRMRTATMFKLTKEQASAALRLQSNPDYKTLCGILSAKQDETERDLRSIDGADLYRCQGRAQVLHGILTLDEAARETLTPPVIPQARPINPDFGQRDNPHFAK